MKKRPWFPLLLCIPLWFLLIISSHASPVFGPQEFSTGWWGAHLSFHGFTADPSADGQLTIIKTTPDKKYRRGFVYLNGKIFGLKSFFRSNAIQLEKTVDLRNENRLIVFYSGRRGASLSIGVNQAPVSPPEITFTSAPSSILMGESSTLSWNVKNADILSIDPAIGAVGPAGSVNVTPIETTIYTLSATGPGGTADAFTTVTVLYPVPTVSINADPLEIAFGAESTLSWSSTDADTCTIEPGIGVVACNGVTTVSPTETMLYTITAVGRGGTVAADVTVSVSNPAPTVSIAANPQIITVGGSTLLSWDATNVAAVHIDRGVGSVSAIGSLSVSPTVTTTYTMSGTGPGGTVSNKVTVSVLGNPDPLPEGTFGAQYNDLIPNDATLDAYDEKRFSLVTGMVEDETGQPLPEVAVTIHDNAAYGTVLTDASGHFAIPVEGGAILTAIYQKDGYITSHRQVDVGWNDYGVIAAIQMLPVDSVETAVAFDGNAGNIMTHTAATITDSFGSRSATMVFSGDNRAYLLDENGNDTIELTAVTVRATEYVTKKSMPSILPPNSAYTYCSEFQVDGAARVRFEKPVQIWVDNFLGFDVGGIVPVGYYNRDKAHWVPSDNGVVVRLLDTDNDGIVDALDSTDDGQPNDLNGNGSFSDEVTGLSDPGRYQSGTTFWRAEVNHFTPWDCNWPYGPPPDATPPDADPPPPAACPVSEGSSETNSYIKHKARSFHEDIPIPGTGLTLHYASDRVKGYKKVISVPVSGPTVPASLKSIIVNLEVAGSSYTKTIAALPEQSAEFIWDGLDFRGNYVEGKIIGRVDIGYVYDGVYFQPGSFSQSFAKAGSNITRIIMRRELISWRSSSFMIRPKEKKQHFGNGWTLDKHHQFINSEVLERGDGSSNASAASIGLSVSTVRFAAMNTIAGSSSSGYSGDGGDARLASMLMPSDVAIDAAGNIYIADTFNDRVRKIDRNDIITTVAGNGIQGFSGDGGDARNASLYSPASVAVDIAGNLFIADQYNHRIRKVDTNGIITTIAGNGNAEFSGDDGPGANAGLNVPNCVALDTAGNLYISDSGNLRIRKLDTNNYITTAYGDGSFINPGNDLPIIYGPLAYPTGIAVDAGGNLFIADPGHDRVQKVDAAGKVTTIAGIKGRYGFSGDNGPGSDALLRYPAALAIDATGNVFVSDYSNHRIRKIDTTGIITTVAGNGTYGYISGILPAKQTPMGAPNGIAVDAKGNLIVSDQMNSRIRKIGTINFVAETGDQSQYYTISDKQDTAHVFTKRGDHLLTVDSNSGKAIINFDYDADNYLVLITDRFNNTTTIERDGQGNPTAIVSPYGHRTTLTVDSHGDLTDIGFEDGSGYGFSYTDGLMTTMTNPRNLVSTHYFDNNGQVVSTEDPENGIWTLDRNVNADGSINASITSSENNTISHLDSREPGYVYRSITTSPGGDSETFIRENQGLDDTLISCGMITNTHYTIDKKSKLKIPASVSVTSPSGLLNEFIFTKSYTEYATGQTLTATSVLNHNGKTITEITDYPSGTVASTSPEGRVRTQTFDANTLLVTDTEINGIQPIHFDYDTQGRMTAAITGSRTTTYGYDTRGNLASVVDPLGRPTNYTYDILNQVTRIDNPDNSAIQFQYDAAGNMTVLTTPVPADNRFEYNGVNKVSNYTTALNSVTTYEYDKERKLSSVGLPSGKLITNTYAGGLLGQTETAEWTTTYTYSCRKLPDSTDRGSERIEYTYDGTLPVTVSLTGTVNETLGLSYNDDFKPSSLTYAGATEMFGYDNDGLLIVSGGFTIDRNAVTGLPEMVSTGNYALTRAFNSYGEVQAVGHTLAGGEVFGYNLLRNDNGKIITKTERVGGLESSFDYSYDNMGRLLTVTKDALQVEEYRYDNNGNRIFEMNSRRGISGRTLTYSVEDHIVSAGAINYQFDADDNLATRIEGGDTTQYAYSSTGELMSVTLPDATLVSYENDPQGRRIAKKINGLIVEKYLWSGPTTLLAVYDGGDALLQRFEYADDRVPYAMTSGGGTYYLSYDQVGSLRMVSDASGNIIKRIDYDTFGNIISDSDESFALPFGFAGGLHDRDTGLVRFGHRDYLPEIGKWTAKDPILFAGGDSNLYGYVLNDPVNFVDPSGLIKWGQMALGMGTTIVGNMTMIGGAAVVATGAVVAAGSAETGPVAPLVLWKGVELMAAGGTIFAGGAFLWYQGAGMIWDAIFDSEDGGCE